MNSTDLHVLEQAILTRLGSADLPTLAEDVLLLSKSFTEGRDELPYDYLAYPRNLRAYVAGFLLTNAAKVLHCLDEAFELGLISVKRSFRVLDLGCGPGTASLAASMFFSKRFPDSSVEFVGVERSGAALAEAEEIFQAIGSAGHRFEGMTGDIGEIDFPSGRFDVVLAANVLNEIGFDDRSLRLCRGVLNDRLAPGGLFIVVDPALKETTRPLMKLRDELSAEGASPLAPCLHGRACPMLAANERDWCHFYVEWERPALIERIDSLTGLDHRHLKMAYLIFAKRGEGSLEHRAGSCRVVSSPLVSKGKRELFLCGSDGRLVRAMRQDKHASEQNRGFELARRGDVVSTKAGEKILPSDSFEIVREWQ
ncbi:MAG TPA: small ribosomal subunit Rsm22 family protein [bacterium]|nr:small ribosomal subunit Rsm22 family protein [bacterium]